ncbi:MAG: GNAT family N-acetyltransferase, partial [Propionibacteriaceae bacterium]|nr:GNAT family N-acetyltransferase [Propionibacteriaceae bacterium]
ARVHIPIRREDPDPAVVASILADLPEGVSMPRPNETYLAAAEHMVTYLATTPAGDTVGVLLLEPHFRESVEVYVMAVRKGYLRQGIGRRLLAVVEADARAFGARLVVVKTIGPSDPNPRAAATRAFYHDVGFLPVEEFQDWWEGRPALMMIKAL